VPTPNRVHLEVNSYKLRMLVTTNFWHKWWKVKVNGTAAKVHRVNYNFQTVEIPPGVSAIESYCVAESLERGKYLSLLEIISILGLFIIGSAK